MKKLLTVEGDPNLRRDPKSGAIININRADIQEAKRRKALRKQNLEEQENLKETVNKLEKDVGEIKSLLQGILEKL